MKRVPKTRTAILLLLAVCCQARVNNVPSEYPTIQAGIDASADGDTVLVAAGTYTGDGNRDIDFEGKAITVKSEDGPEVCIIDSNGTEEDLHRGFIFHSGEDANSILEGFTITNGYATYATIRYGGGIYCEASSPRVENCRVTRNVARFGGGIACVDSNSVIANCIISDNTASVRRIGWYGSGPGAGGGITLSGRGARPMVINCIVTGNRASEHGGGISCGSVNSTIVNCTIYGNRTGGLGNGGGITSGAGGGYKALVHNCIIWGNTARTGEQIGCKPGGILGSMILNLSYCSVQGGPNAIWTPFVEGHWASLEPLFVDPGRWDPNGTQDNRYDDFWVDGSDYHLKSEAGRWNPNSQSWVQDDVTSPCIDAGDPNSPIGHEPFPNGGMINIGAYGGTAEASKSYFGEPVCETVITGDINGDCKVDFEDFRLMANHWLVDSTAAKSL